MRTLILLAALLLAGCAGLPSQEITAGDIGGDFTTKTLTETYNYQMEMWQFGALILLAGWAIPSPAEMFGAASRFILKLVGR